MVYGVVRCMVWYINWYIIFYMYGTLVWYILVYCMEYRMLCHKPHRLIYCKVCS